MGETGQSGFGWNASESGRLRKSQSASNIGVDLEQRDRRAGRSDVA